MEVAVLGKVQLEIDVGLPPRIVLLHIVLMISNGIQVLLVLVVK